MIPHSEWEWFGTPGHLICAHDCRFHLCTKVGNFLISTVGEYWPSRQSREIHARIHDPKWLEENVHLKGDYFDNAYMLKFGYENIGCDRKYETMVFKAGERCSVPDCMCGLPKIEGSEVDFHSANDRKSAADGHHALCMKYAMDQTDYSVEIPEESNA